MKNTIIKAIFLFFLTLSSINIVYADQVSNHDMKTYILKITSKDPNKVVPFSGSFMTVFDNDSVITDISNRCI